MRALTVCLIALITPSAITIAQHHSLSAHSDRSTQHLSLSTQHSIPGIWLGVLEVQGFKLRLVLKVTQTPEGKLAAKMDSLDQAATDLPIDTITSEGDVVRFEARALSLT